jgi:hypothetical protein
MQKLSVQWLLMIFLAAGLMAQQATEQWTVFAPADK